MNGINGQSSLIRGENQIFKKGITSFANAGDVVVATATDNDVLIKSIVVVAYSAAPAELTSAGIFGGAGKVVTFIAAADALLADLDAVDKQVYWVGAVHLVQTKTIVISLVGTGPVNVDLIITVEYEAIGDGGYLL